MLVRAPRNMSSLFSLSPLHQHHEMHVLCFFSHFESVTNSTVFCALAKIMYLGFLSDILNTCFLSSHTECIVWVEFLLCGRPAKPHSHTHTPRCGPRGFILSGFQEPTTAARGPLPHLPQPQWASVCSLTVHSVGFGFVFKPSSE